MCWSLSNFQVRIPKIGHEHMPGLVRQQQRRSRLHCDSLGSHAAGPEDRLLVGTDFDGITEIGAIDVRYTDGRGVADVNRRSVRQRKTLADACRRFRMCRR